MTPVRACRCGFLPRSAEALWRHIEEAHGAETTLPPVALNPDTEKALRTAGRKVAEWTTERDRLIRQAVEEGGSLREVGAAAGLTHTAVKFIAHGRPPKP